MPAYSMGKLVRDYKIKTTRDITPGTGNYEEKARSDENKIEWRFGTSKRPDIKQKNNLPGPGS
jgi:hypothetical protein